MNSDNEEFGTFLAALRDFRRDEAEVRPTAHTSSVNTLDWKAVEQSMRKA